MGVAHAERKVVKDRMVNAVSHMATAFGGFPRHSFLGFIPITIADYGFGVDINGENYTGCHMFNAPEWFGDAEPDTGNVRKNKPWVLMFAGSDDRSYYARFRTQQDAIIYFNKIAVFNRQVLNRCYPYN